MSFYQQQLTALGLSEEVVNRHLAMNEMQKFRNLESEAYGRNVYAIAAEIARGHTYEADETLDGRLPSTDTYGE